MWNIREWKVTDIGQFCKIYKKLGFNVVGTVPEAFRLKDGTYTDLFIMFMDLKLN